MNRVIKFRLRVEDKIVGYEKFYEGQWSTDDGHWLARPCWLYSKDGEYWNPEYIYHSAKDSFTGLLDKNGKEIYEGDVVQVFYHDKPQTDENKAYTVIIEDIRSNFVGVGDGHGEVIGNIYENPELV